MCNCMSAIPAHRTEPVSWGSAAEAEAGQVEGGRAAIAAQQPPVAPAHATHLFMLRLPVLAGIPLCTHTRTSSPSHDSFSLIESRALVDARAPQ